MEIPKIPKDPQNPEEIESPGSQPKQIHLKPHPKQNESKLTSQAKKTLKATSPSNWGKTIVPKQFISRQLGIIVPEKNHPQKA